MRRFAWLTVLAVSSAHADAPVIGGSNAPQGMWPDAAAMMYSGQAECSGTLVAPTVVLTAAHCADPSEGPPPDHVLVGTASLDRPQDGETIAVGSHTEFPDWQTSVDISVLVLAQPAKEAPRAIATGWARPDIKNGATVNFVGFGTIDKNGTMQVADMQEATSTITDFACLDHPDCNEGAKPAGELGAGGMGIDTCPGDSGGPMYLPTSLGTFLAGVTSRGYQGNTFACGEGGIYERPDHVVDWIEQTAGVPVSRGPEPALDGPLEAARNAAAEATIDANDPASDDHAFAIKAPPMHGTAAVRDDGRIRVCVGSDAPAGDETVVVTITDTHDATRTIDADFTLTVDDASDPGPCDPGFPGEDNGGCCSAQGGGGANLPVALGTLAILLRRRRVC